MKVNTKRIEKGLWWDRAWSLVEGCTPISEGCVNCWSAAQTHMRAYQKNPAIKERYEGLTESNPRFNGEIRLMWEDLKKPTPKQKPMTWAVWNDLFHEKMPVAFAIMAFERMYLCPQHTFVVCTKRSRFMKNNMPVIWAVLKTKYPDAQIPLPNVIGMVTAENQEAANLRIPDLARAPFALKAVNAEPMLEFFLMPEALVCLGCNRDLDKRDCGCPAGTGKRFKYRIDWVICGAETGPGARPFKIGWAKDLREQCKKAKVPFWMKAGNVGEELPEDLKVREMPGVIINN